MSEADAENKRIAKNTAVLYVRMLISMFIGFFTSRILLNQLGVIDYGIYNVVGSIVVMLGFLNSTLSLSTQRFINYELGSGNYDRLSKVYSSSIVIHAALAFLVLIIAETVGLWFLNTHMNIPTERMVAANYVYQFSIFSAMFSIIMIPHSATIIAHEHMKQYATIGIIDVLLRLCVACMLYIIQTDKLIVYALAMFLVVLANYLTYYIYCKKKFPECSFIFSKDKQLYREMLSFSGWNIFSSISMILNGQVVSIIMNIFFGPIVNAARGISSQVNGAIGGFVQNFQIAVNPRIIQTFAADEIQTFYRLINQSAKFSFFLLLIFVVPVWINIDDILQLWLGTVPEHTADFCRIIFISSLINTFSLPLATAANATGNIKIFQLACGVFEILNIPFSYLLLKLGNPPVSVYLVQLTITISTLLIRLIVLRKLVNLNIYLFFTKIVFRCLFVAVLSFSTMMIVTYINVESILGLLSSIFISLSLTVLSIILLGLNREEKAIAMNLIKNKLHIK